jgi:DNA-binding MarR family transcriptional regulator
VTVRDGIDRNAIDHLSVATNIVFPYILLMMNGSSPSRANRSQPVARTRAAQAQIAFASLMRAADRLEADVSILLKSHGVSGPQYNVLRILRGAAPDGLPCRKIADRMITRVPDVTRLIDRLLRARMVVRDKDSADRRIVRVRISERGMTLLEALDAPVASLHETQFARLSLKEMSMLRDLLGSLEDVSETTGNRLGKERST